MTLYYEDYRLDGTPEEICEFVHLMECREIEAAPRKHEISPEMCKKLFNLGEW